MTADLDHSALRARLIASVVQHCPAGPRQRYNWLSDNTAINGSAWKNLFNMKQLATVDMLVAWCRLFPAATSYVLHGEGIDDRATVSPAAAEAMKDSERSQEHLLKSAIQKVGGLRLLSRQLEWHSGAISEVLAGKVRLSPYRAGQCAALLGAGPDEWIFDSLRRGSKTTGERAYWTTRVERALARGTRQRTLCHDFPACLIADAIKKAGGIRALARAIDGWDAASVVKARDNLVLSPYRAAQLAQYVEVDTQQALMAALAAGSKSASEAEFWDAFDAP